MTAEKPDRLIRFVDDDTHTVGHVCTFDPVANILRIRRKYYDVLTEREQKIVWRAKESLTFQDIEKITKQRAK